MRSELRPQLFEAIAGVDVRIVDFPETRVAVLEHHGLPGLEHQTAKRLVQWRLRHRLSPDRHRTYGVHYTDPRTTAPEQHRVDFCVSVDEDVAPNPEGVVTKVTISGSAEAQGPSPEARRSPER